MYTVYADACNNHKYKYKYPRMMCTICVYIHKEIAHTDAHNVFPTVTVTVTVTVTAAGYLCTVDRQFQRILGGSQVSC